MTEAEILARRFYYTYQRLAPSTDETSQFDPSTPDGQLLIAICENLLKYDVKLNNFTDKKLELS